MGPILGGLSGAALLKRSLFWQLCGLALLVGHVLLVRESILLFPVIMLVIGWLYWQTPLGGLLIFFQVLLLQNITVSIFSPDLEPTVFSALLGTNFVVLGMMAGFAIIRLWPLWQRELSTIAITLLIAGGLMLVYLALGIVQAGATSGLIYFREFAAPLLAVVVGFDVGRTWGYRTIAQALLYSAIVPIMVSTVEYLASHDFYLAINAVRYYQLKYLGNNALTFYTPQDIIAFYTAPFFNISDIESIRYQNFRFGGTIINPISNAYILGIVALVAISLRQPIWLLWLAPMLLLIGVKGASIMVIASLFLWLVWLILRNRGWTIAIGALMAVSYVIIGIYIGLQNNDFHVIGFLGGVNSLLSTPQGHGIGVGGNFSAASLAGFNWTGSGGFQSAGADFALESAVGVLIYQMGLAACAIFAVIIAVLAQVPLGGSRFYARPLPSDILFFALAVVAVNGIFQEEAYAPYALGLVMLLVGVLIANRRRQSVSITLKAAIA